MTLARIGLGGNSVSARQDLARAAQMLAKLPGTRLAAFSPVYASAPVGCPGRQREYCNAAATLQTTLAPRRVFGMLQKLERRIQRRRRRRNAPRRLDLDYLLHGAAVLRGKSLCLPHPRMRRRAFVLLPLADISGKFYAGLPNARALCEARGRCGGQTVRRLP
ncbi:MAG: 2-amino-4-hydroxy-6-hydroxymethyldihydropteridine diphosphokinase [Gammaproteobacteria bacterium]